MPSATAAPTTANGRERLLDAAERLFAERGIEGVSLREVGAEAGQRNNSAAQYHFGSRDGLVDAVFRLRMTPINERRLAMVDALEQDGRTDDLRALLEAWTLPLVEAVAGGGAYARFLAQVLDRGELAVFDDAARPETAGLRRVSALLDRHLAHLPPAVRAHRLWLAGTLVVHALADRERTVAAGRRALVPDALAVADLLDALEGLLTAPASPPARGPRRRSRRNR